MLLLLASDTFGEKKINLQDIEDDNVRVESRVENTSSETFFTAKPEINEHGHRQQESSADNHNDNGNADFAESKNNIKYAVIQKLFITPILYRKKGARS